MIYYKGIFVEVLTLKNGITRGKILFMGQYMLLKFFLKDELILSV